MMNREELTAGLDLLGIEYKESQIEQLDRYVQELLLWNKKLNLIGPNQQDLVSRHLLDCLSPVKIFQGMNFERMADVGSGAGLPGIPLAIFLPDKKVTLIERSRKRCGFLRNVIILLGLQDRVQVVEETLEQVSAAAVIKETEGDTPDQVEGFDLVVFRAFRELGDFAALLLGLLKPGGVLGAYKGRREQIDLELKWIQESDCRSDVADTKVDPLDVPGLNEERHLLRIQKS